MSGVAPGPRTPAELAALLAEQLVGALVAVRIYAVTHPRVQSALLAVQQSLRELASASREDPTRLGWAEDLLVYQQRPMLGASLAAARLIELLRQWQAGGIELHSEVTAEELTELFTGMVARPAAGETWAALNARLQQRRCRRAQLLPPFVAGPAGSGRTGRPDSGSQLHVAVRFYQGLVDLLQDVTVAVCRGGRIDFGPVQAQAEQVLKRLEADDGPLLNLARQDQYDAFTFGHSVRVAVLAMNFARALTDDRELLVRIGAAALLHDVGKALIPFELLHVQRRLTADEYREVSRHPQLGAELLLDHHDSDPLAISAAFGHHRTANGGYPRTLHSHRSSMVTEIVKLCDVYEALTAARPYKQPMSPVRAYRVMLAMSDRFHRGLLRRFIEVNGIFPVGQHVTLTSGELALVRAQSRDPLRPVVVVVADAEGHEPAAAGEQVFDLSSVDCGCARAILGEAPRQVAEHAREQELLGR